MTFAAAASEKTHNYLGTDKEQLPLGCGAALRCSMRNDNKSSQAAEKNLKTCLIKQDGERLTEEDQSNHNSAD